MTSSAVRYGRASQKSEQVHPDEASEQEVLNRLAAIQAAAEILADNEDLSPSDAAFVFS